MLYTGRGDNGTTSVFDCDQRFSKSSAIAEALGTLDEVNSFLGVIKVQSRAQEIIVSSLSDQTVAELMGEVQHNLFIVQAEVAGADKHIAIEKVDEMEVIINAIEKELPPIKSFFVSGGTELAALVDFSRALARRAERCVVGVADEGVISVHKETLVYLNRLSTLLYATARQVNHKSGITEEPPSYR